MWFPSSAVAVTVSPGSRVRFVAKSITRVRSSWLKGTGVAGANGSARRLIDSNASARVVELVFVSNTGAVARRASVGASSTIHSKERMRTKATRRLIYLMLSLGLFVQDQENTESNWVGHAKSRKFSRGPAYAGKAAP